MNDPFASRPAPDEYAEFYAGYVGQVPDGSVMDTLAAGAKHTLGLVAGLTEARAGHRYAPGKWSIKEVVGHVIDSERVFAYRGLCFARNDRTPLPGFDENAYVAVAGFDPRPLAELASELRLVRAASIALFTSLDEEALARRGTANDRLHTARAVPWIIAGHELHHLDVVSKRYLYTAEVSGR